MRVFFIGEETPEMELFDVNGRVVALIVSEEQICVTWVRSS